MIRCYSASVLWESSGTTTSFSFCCFVLDMRHGEADGALHHGVSHLIHHQPVISRDESERWEIAGGEVPIVFMNVVMVARARGHTPPPDTGK